MSIKSINLFLWNKIFTLRQYIKLSLPLQLLNFFAKFIISSSVTIEVLFYFKKTILHNFISFLVVYCLTNKKTFLYRECLFLLC